MLRLGLEEYNLILSHAQKGLPCEACGLIGGTLSDEVKIVKEVYLLKNLDESNEHFSMDPREQLAAIKDLRKKNLSFLGNFHSHPATPSRPSEEDIRLAYDPNSLYLILSLQDINNPVLKAFQIRSGEVTEEPIEII